MELTIDRKWKKATYTIGRLYVDGIYYFNTPEDKDRGLRQTDTVLVNTTAAKRTFTMGTWTRAELNDIRLKMYAKRSTGNTSSSYYLRLYGLDLSITYTYTPSA